MPTTPGVFIETGTSAVVHTKPAHEFDPITGHGPAGRDYANDVPVVLERDINKPKDYTVSVYRTCDAVLYTQFQNNIVTNVTHSPNLNHFELKKYLDIDNGQGVYIVERYNLSGVTKSRIPDILEYYAETRGLAYDSDTIAVIKEHVNQAGTKGKRFSTAVIRILTYVPFEKLKENQYTYINGPGVVIIHGSVPGNLYHPYSPAYLEDTLVKPVNDDGSVTIDISVIDSDNKPYYYMLGNSVKTVRPIHIKKNTVLPLGGTITTRRSGDVVDENYFGLEDFENNGFYRSKELCITNGNKSLILDEHKYSIELKKAQLELQKIKDLNQKLVLEKETREQQAILDTERKAIEFDYYRAGKSIDLIQTSTKFKLDNLSKIADIHCAHHKVHSEIVKLNNDLRKADHLHQFKMVDQVIKLLDLIVRILK